MGLYTTHNCWHGPYSSFNRWRNAVARAADYELENLGYIEVPKMDWNKLTVKNAYGEWKKTPKDPLIVLFVHSDCEGVIHPEQAISLADRLEEIIDLIPNDKSNEFWIDPQRHKDKTRQFIDGLRLAASKGEDVEFL